MDKSDWTHLTDTLYPVKDVMCSPQIKRWVEIQVVTYWKSAPSAPGPWYCTTDLTTARSRLTNPMSGPFESSNFPKTLVEALKY